MKDKDINYDFNDIFPKDIRDDFLFPLDTYRLFLEGLSINPSLFYQKWSDVNMQLLLINIGNQIQNQIGNGH